MAKKDLDFDLNEFIDLISDDVKKGKDFDDLINFEAAINREIALSDIASGSGTTVNSYIRFWNKQDENDNIPVEERKPIKIYLDSNGGYLSDCFTICDSIKLSKTPVWIIVTGCAYSSAFDICTHGHKRFAYPHSTFLFHEGSTGISGTVNQFQNYASFNKELIKKTKEYLLANTKITEEQYKEKEKEDWWMDAEEALKWGVIDEIVEELI